MTEIPEHLLKRSQERRAAAGLPTAGGDTPTGTPSATTPVVATPTAARTPAVPVAPPPVVIKPVPAVVMAAQSRHRIPIWAMPVVVFLPLWLWMYVLATQKPEVVVTGPLKEGVVVYNNCSSCHGADGSGGVGYPLYNGSVVKTFPKIEDQINFVYNGTKGFSGKPYGDPNRAGGARIGGQKGQMPNWGEKTGGALSDAELVAAICHERYSLGGVDAVTAAKPDYVKEQTDWCSADGVKWLAVEEKGIAAGAGVDLAVK